MGEVIRPPAYQDLRGPLIFLAGPIQGAPDWHAETISLLQATDIFIASPRRPDSEGGDFSQDAYNEQVAWEHYHLQRAGENGVSLFWLAREARHQCDRAYAQTSQFELGEAVTLHRWKGIKVVVGIEKGFSNARYLRTTITRKAPAVPLCSTLRETCDAVLEILG